MAICGRKTGYTRDFSIFSKYVDMSIKKSTIQSLILHNKQFAKKWGKN